MYRPGDQTARRRSIFLFSSVSVVSSINLCQLAPVSPPQDDATPLAENIVAPFDGRTLRDGPRTYPLHRDGEYTIDMPKYGPMASNQVTAKRYQW